MKNSKCKDGWLFTKVAFILLILLQPGNNFIQLLMQNTDSLRGFSPEILIYQLWIQIPANVGLQQN